MTPPSFLERLGAALMRGERGQVVLGDLAEEYAQRQDKGESRLRGALWYLSQLFVSFAAVAMGPRGVSRGTTRSKGDSTMQGWFEELRVIARNLVRRPGFSLPVVLTLALGIGIGSTVFSVVQATLLHRPGFLDPERLVMVWNRQQASAESSHLLSGADYTDIRERSRTLDDVAALLEVNVAPVTGGDGPARFARMGSSTSNLFDVLGVEPFLGRLFLPEDQTPLPEPPEGATPPIPPPYPVILSYDYWQREFGGDPDVLGRRFYSFTLDQVVVGVLPPDFQLVLPQEALMGEDLGAAIDLWMTYRTDYSQWSRTNRGLRVVARLSEGSELADARGELDGLALELRAEHDLHEENGLRLGAEPLVQQSSSHLRPLLGLLSGAVLGVLLVACVNAAGLLLTRMVARERELDVRTALGASGRSLARLVLAESLVLGALGGLAGIVLAVGGMRLLQWLRPAGLPQAESLRLNLGVLAFALLLALLSSLAAGLIPTVRVWRRQRHDLAGHRHTATRHQRRLHEGMVAAQIALTVLLLIGTGLMLRSFVKLQQVPLGFEPEGVLTVDFSTIGPQPDRTREDWFAEWIMLRRGLERTLGERLAELPGVEASGAVFPVPLNGVYSRTCSYVLPGEGRALSSGVAYFRNVWPGYFDTLGIPLLAGRDLTFEDDQAGLVEWTSLDDGPRQDSPRVVIDSRLAERLWPGESAVGRRLTFDIYDEKHPAEVVGVVPFVPQAGLLDPMETIYIPRSYYRSQELTLTMRLAQDSPAIRETITGAIHEVYGESPVGFVPLDDYVHRALAPSRFVLMLLGVFAGVALLLASIGLYGTMGLMVRSRTREIGIQMAMGAAPRDVGRSVVLRAAVLSLAGIVSGAVVGLVVTRLLVAHLFEVAPTDPITFLGAGTFQLATCVLASWLPARRAAGVDPTTALRAE